MDINGGLMASAAVLGPILVYFTSKRGQKDAARQSAAATRITEDKAALDSWKAIAERHEKDRDDARAMEAAARCREDEERQKRRDTEVLLDAANGRIRELHDQNLTLRGMVAKETLTAAASMLPEYNLGVEETTLSPRELRRPPSDVIEVEESPS